MRNIEYKRLEFLRKCAELDGTEWGEVVFNLLQLYEGNHGLISPKLDAALEEEVLGQLEWAEESCRIVTKTETREVTFEELEFDDE